MKINELLGIIPGIFPGLSSQEVPVGARTARVIVGEWFGVR
jgi:hypothetical protein